MVNEVENLLNNEGIQFIPSGRDFLIRCLNPDHEDRHPSLRIDKLQGMGKCLSCGFKINVFKHFGVHTDGKSARIALLKEKIQACISQSVGLQIPQKSIPYLTSYRGISIQTIREFDAFTHSEFPSRILFPMRTSSGKIVAFNGRALESGMEPKYEIYPRGVTLPMYPGKINPINGSIFLVEGIVDFLNVYDKGLTNTVAILGVTTLHNKHGLHKESVAQFKLSGVSKIYLMLDGDTAGRKAMEELKPLLEAADFYVEIIELEDDTDPGELDSSDVQMLLNKVKGRHT